MPAIEYIIGPTDVSEARDILADHLSRPPRFSFRVMDFKPVAAFAVAYFFDAVQETVSRAMVGEENIDITLPSGWRARKVDIGHLWKRHIEFTSPADAGAGFVFEGLLDPVETVSTADERRTREELADDVISGLQMMDVLVEENVSNDRFRPENSTAVQKVSAYRFGVDDGYQAKSSVSLLRSLLKGHHSSETFEHYVQTVYDGGSLDTDRAGRSITEPGEAIELLGIVAEFVRAYDPQSFERCLREHASIPYNTLVGDYAQLLRATRSAISGHGAFPSATFSELVEELWRHAACEDVMRNLHYVTETADALIEMGHTSRQELFDCNDGRTRAYAQTDGETVSVLSEWERWSTLIKVRNDRVAVYKCDFDTGAILDTVVDFRMDDGMVTGINEIHPYEDMTAGVMKRSLVDLSSVHCHVVTEPVVGSAPSPAP
jgi:hypothetical protein